MPDFCPLKTGLRAHLDEKRLGLLSRATIGIAGAGGLGSNVTMLLARSGIENFLIVDCDYVEPSNLNRQQYWPEQVGLKKVEALGANLMALNPDIRLDLRHMRLNRENLLEILPLCPIWVEALDAAENKSMFVESALLQDRLVIAASGICGCGGLPMRKRRVGRLSLVGDFASSQGPDNPPLAPRVVQAAALIADCVLEYLLQYGEAISGPAANNE